MPLPKTKDVGKVMKVLNKEKPNMSRKQKIAIALNQTGKSKQSKKSSHAKEEKKETKGMEKYEHRGGRTEKTESHAGYDKLTRILG